MDKKEYCEVYYHLDSGEYFSEDSIEDRINSNEISPEDDLWGCKYEKLAPYDIDDSVNDYVNDHVEFEFSDGARRELTEFFDKWWEKYGPKIAQENHNLKYKAKEVI